MTFPVALCVVGAVTSFWATVSLRRFKVRATSPAFRAHLSQEERQRKIRVASWIVFGMGCFYVLGAIVLAILK